MSIDWAMLESNGHMIKSYFDDENFCCMYQLLKNQDDLARIVNRELEANSKLYIDGFTFPCFCLIISNFQEDSIHILNLDHGKRHLEGLKMEHTGKEIS